GMAHAEMAAMPVAVEDEDPLRMQGALDALAHEPRGVGQRVAAAHLVHQREEHLLGVVGLAEEASIEPPTELRAEAEHHGPRAGTTRPVGTPAASKSASSTSEGW